jgi:hypothetical protein
VLTIARLRGSKHFANNYKITRAKEFEFSASYTLTKNSLAFLVEHMVTFEDDFHPTSIKIAFQL